VNFPKRQPFVDRDITSSLVPYSNTLHWVPYIIFRRCGRPVTLYQCIISKTTSYGYRNFRILKKTVDRSLACRFFEPNIERYIFFCFWITFLSMLERLILFCK
jgi:hypothetical protein